MDIQEIAKGMTRIEFVSGLKVNDNGVIVLNICGQNIDCPGYLGLKTDKNCMKDDVICNFRCIKCWKEAIKDIKFKGEDDMLKKDLKDGMIIECRNEMRFLKLGKDFLGYEETFDINELDKDLESVECASYDIMKIYTAEVNPLNILMDDDNLDLIWERKGNMKCMNCGREIQTEMEQHIEMVEGKVFCCGRCAGEYHNRKAEVKTRGLIKDYDREYSINEVFQFEEGTEFEEINSGATIKIKDEELLSLVLAFEDGKEKWEGILFSKTILNDKFKLKRKEKEVEFIEAITSDKKIRFEFKVDEEVKVYLIDYFPKLIESLKEYAGNNKYFLELINDGKWFEVE